MKNFNFNSLQNLPTPESWIENALNIPAKEEQKPAVIPFWRKPRVIAAAASLILVSALSVALFLSMNNAPVPVKPNSKQASTEIVWSTDANGETVATEVVIVPDTADRQDPTQASESPSRLSPERDPDAPAAPTSSTENGRRTPTEGGKSPAAPTAPQAPGSTESFDSPTEQYNPTEAIKPTEKQPYEPQQPPTATPWIPSYPSEAPTEACGEQPTGPPQPVQPYPKRRVLYVSIPQEAVPSDGAIYCRLYAADGEAFGDEDRYAEARRMTFLAYGTKYTYYYVISDHITIPAAAEGTTVAYEVYDSSGNLLVSGSYLLR